MKILANEQGRVMTMNGFREGADFIAYEQVPLGRFDLVFCYERQRWIDRRTSDGEILAVDRRNAREG